MPHRHGSMVRSPHFTRLLVGASVLGLAGALAGCAEHPGTSTSTGSFPLQTDPAIGISQVYGGGGNASAIYANDFVELHNRTAMAVAVDGMSVQYASATGTGNLGANANQLAILSGVVPAGGYYLIRLASGGATGAALPIADATNTGINMSGSAGKVALVNGTTGLGCNGGSAPCDAAASARIVDLVGYGNADFREGTAVPTLGNTTAALRKDGGCTDSNDNLADFTVVAPVARNSVSTAVICGGPSEQAPSIVATSPANGAANVSPATAVQLTFSESVTVAGSWFSFTCSATGPVAATVTGGPTAFTLTPAAPLAEGEACQIVVAASAVTDNDSFDPPDQMASDFVLGFTIAPPVTAIAVHAVQGAAHTSPLLGQTVTIGQAVVTARKSNGFYIQALNPDADDATSEGVFVFTSSAPAAQIGDVVTVRGLVTEFRPGCSGCSPSDSAYSNLTSTEIGGSPVITIQSHGQALPDPIVLGSGAGHRAPPTQIIADDAAGGNVESGGAFDPTSDGIDFYESLEGMRVRIDDAVAVSPSVAFSGGSIEIAVLAEGGAGAGLRTPRGGIIVQANDFNPERIILENSLTPAFPTVNVGDSFPGAVIGVIDYEFANFKLLVSQPLPAVASAGLAPEITALVTAAPTQLTMASLNVENLDPTDPPAKFARLATVVVQNLGAPDLVALEEVQDNNGAANDAVVDAATTLATFITAISSAGGPTYSYRQINPVDDQDGGEPGGNIRVAILFRTDRGLGFVDRGAATSTTANSVDVSAGTPHLAFSPGRIDPTNTAFASSRKPLAAELTFAGRPLFVIANHFNSKGGDQPLFGRFQPPARSSETQRLKQANLVAGFVATILQADANAAVVVLGDLNDFSFSPQLAALRAVGLSDLIETLPSNERYSYVYEGNSQDLDHILVSAALAPRSTFDVVHVNAEFADQSSDHDPGVVRFDFGTAPVITSVPPSTVLRGTTLSYAVTATGAPAPTFALSQSPTGMTIDPVTGLISWTANVSAGGYPVVVIADNGVAPAASQSFTLTVVVAAAAVPAATPAAAFALVILLLAAGVLVKSSGRARPPAPKWSHTTMV
jgi:predicted extracellular nuclease